MRKNISSGTAWEQKVGYSRAVRVGNIVEVAGTVAVNQDGEVMGDDAYTQACFIFEKIEKALQQAGVSLQDVIRTRVYLTDLSAWEGAGEAHARFFKDILPASTMLVVSALANEKLLVEIEASAFIHER